MIEALPEKFSSGSISVLYQESPSVFFQSIEALLEKVCCQSIPVVFQESSLGVTTITEELPVFQNFVSVHSKVFCQSDQDFSRIRINLNFNI